MTGHLLLVRHGRTPWNDAGRLQGWASVGLSERGREEAADLGRRLAAEYAVDRVVTSPIRRAVETAVPVARLVECDEIRCEPGWRERSFGIYEGYRAAAVFDAVPEIHPRSDNFDSEAEPPDGESVVAVRDRVRRQWRSLRDRIRSAESTVVLVTHTTPIRLLLGEIDGTPLREALRSYEQRPGTVREIDVSR